MNGSSLTMGPVTRHQAGVYQCVATNGVGFAASRDVTLRVLYAPEVEVEESWIHTGIGNRAILTCTVFAEPPPEVRWYRSSLKLDVTDDHNTDRIGNRHRLTIKSVQHQDMDNYTCEAHNNLGKAKRYLVLSGKPHAAAFRGSAQSRWRDSYNISWSVFSYTPLEEYRLYYRRKQYTGQYADKWVGTSLPHQYGNLTYWYMREWSDVILPANSGSEVTAEMSYLIKNLEPSMQYEAKVQSRNSFGWSKMSELFTFSTRGLDGYSWEPEQEILLSHENEVRDLGVRSHNDGSSFIIANYNILILGCTGLLWLVTS